MSKITVLGGTGYTGSHLVREAASRGHAVTSFSRSIPTEPIAGVRYETGSLLDDAVRQSAVDGADVVIGALAPRGELESQIEAVYSRFGDLVASTPTRFVVVGGFSALRPAEGAPRFAEGDDLPPEFVAEARAMYRVLVHLEDAAPADLDWLYVSPAANYGSYAPGEPLGTYRAGGQVALFDANGESAISGADFARAILDEIENPANRRVQRSFAY